MYAVQNQQNELLLRGKFMALDLHMTGDNSGGCIPAFLPY